MGLGDKIGRSETGAIKQLFRALSVNACMVNPLDACELADRAIFVVEDGMLSMHSLIQYSTSSQMLFERMRRYFLDIRAKHGSAEEIVVSMDDHAPISKKMEQASRDKNPFSEDEICEMGDYFFLSEMSSKKDYFIAQMITGKDNPSENETKQAFRQYSKRFLPTRRFKPDAIMTMMMAGMADHNDHATKSSYNTTMILDGVPWPFSIREVLTWHEDEEKEEVDDEVVFSMGAAFNGETSQSFAWSQFHQTKYVPSCTDGSWLCSNSVPIPFTYDDVKDRYKGHMCNCKQTARIKMTQTGAFVLPFSWKEEGESDTKIAEMVRRAVYGYVRSSSEGTRRKKNKSEDLPVIWVTSCDTDSLVIFLLLLEELFGGDPNKVDFQLYLDTTYSSHAYVPYHNISGIGSINDQNMRLDRYTSRFQSKKLSKCLEVWNMTELWIGLHRFLAKLPGAGKQILPAFLMMMISRGTDFVTALCDVPLHILTRCFFSGGYLFLQKAIRFTRDFHNEEDTENSRNEDTASCLEFRCSCSSAASAPYRPFRMKMNEYYAMEFFRLALFWNLRLVPSAKNLFPTHVVPDDFKAIEYTYKTTLNNVLSTALTLRSQNSDMHVLAFKLTDPSKLTWKQRGKTKMKDTPEMKLALLERYIKQFEAKKLKLVEEQEKLRDVILSLAKYVIPEDATPSAMRNIARKWIPTNTELVDFSKRALHQSHLSNSASLIKSRNNENPEEDCRIQFKKRKLSETNIAVWTRVVHTNMHYWTRGTQHGFEDRSTAIDKKQKVSVAGFTENMETGKVSYAKEVCIH